MWFSIDFIMLFAMKKSLVIMKFARGESSRHSRNISVNPCRFLLRG